RRQLLDLEVDLPGHAAHGQVAAHDEAVPAPRDRLRPEGQRRVGGGVEEVGRAQVLVALRLARVDRGRVDGDVDGRVLRVLQVEIDRPGHLAEAAADVRDHEVADGELGGRVRRVDVPAHVVLFLRG